MDRILIKYRTPEDYVKKSALKALKTDKKFATGRLMINSSNDPLTPYEINKHLAEETRHFQPEGESEAQFLKSPEMSEVAKSLEREGVLDNITGKKEIKSRFGLRLLERRQGTRTGGSPSVYKTREAFENVKNVMAKQEARDLLREKLLKLPVTLNFERFVLKSSLILIKRDESYTEKVLRLVAPSQDLKQLAESQPSRHLLVQRLNSLMSN